MRTRLLKELSHWTIFRATCLATFLKRVELQLYEHGCYTVHWDCQQLAKLRPRRTEERIIRILIGLSSKELREVALRNAEEVVTAIVAKRKIKFYFLQRLRQQ